MRSPSDPKTDASSEPNPGDKARKPGRPPSREDRLKAALKANMARRKAQAKARSAEDAPGKIEKPGKTEGKD
jgi:hypothetical protein